MKQTLTHEQEKAGVVRNQARVIDLLHWSLAAYSAHLYNCGLRFLEVYLSNDEDAVAKLAPRREFWNWWKNLFNARDEAFIEAWDGLEDSISTEDLRELYHDIHKPEMLACELAPPTIAFPPDFATIKSQL